ncbi:DUF2336 domain-containing protein [Devosia sp. XJ19-1]|uniref:DUF2336 domain-containing protein n=1 Tax=Devosia ureilytica TaxID=2952754 RepID=A0A9Q4ALC1_9HYPH|nr:DUF2336 domain-containing protein [Devosia ureilytica]MCP8881901.1 DUF2336 domain-containing protein [Devosia ureilytica]MCP8886213.1 DUF2336 domain-containing protein [Devosia ureilytica]
MIGYEAFAELSLSSDSDERGYAAHLAALAYLDHQGPADEHAALYAALIGFLDDSSVKVRAALAYGLLHSPQAPRSVMLALLQDSAVIARAVLQYSPVLVYADLYPIVARGDITALTAIAQRQSLSPRLVSALLGKGERGLILRLLKRRDVDFEIAMLEQLSRTHGDDATIRGALLARRDLPGTARMQLVRAVADSLGGCRLVKGALAADRLGRLLRDGTDTAVAIIGETEPVAGRAQFVDSLMGADQVSARLLLHSVVTGKVMFFAACIAGLANTGSDKVYTLLEGGSRVALAALFSRCGLSPAIGGLLVRLVMLARSVDLADDPAARHYVITALTEELISEYDGDIPPELEEVFCYLNDQNIALARKAARGVVAMFAKTTQSGIALPAPQVAMPLQLPAA